MKNIAIFAYNFTIEYTTSVLKGIFRFFKNRDDVRIFYAQTKLPNISIGFFEYQYWAAAEFLNTNFIDEVIVVSNSYFYYISVEDFLRTISPFFKKKCVSVGFDLKTDNSYCTETDCKDSYDEIIGHLKSVHGCTRFAFLSANKLGSEEALERYEAYKSALKNHGLVFDESLVFDGAFTSSSAREELARRVKSRDDINFDVLLCANDLMAVGCIDYFLSMGVAVPDEVKIVGFDNTSHAALCNPSITTIDPSIGQQGYDAAELALSLLETPDAPAGNRRTSLQIRYRRSCGCNPVGEGTNMNKYHSLLSYYDDINGIDFLFDFVRGASSLAEIAESLIKIGYMFGFSTLTACMYDEPFALKQSEHFDVPDSVRFVMHVNLDSGKNIVDENGEVFNPHERLIPSCLETEELKDGGQFVFQPIFLGEYHYGYIICKLRRPAFAMNSVVLKILASVLSQGHNYSKTLRRVESLNSANRELQSDNIALKKQSTTDELTGLLNRRGFSANAQKLVSFAAEMQMNGLVCFADLDGLKQINDTFGHDYGDLAIKLQAKVLRTAFRQTDIIGRLSGDEFGIVSVGMDLTHLEKMRRKIAEIDTALTKENNLPFDLSISLGATAFDDTMTDLGELLKLADDDLYEQKKIHHSRMDGA